jgi:hypothetical protein
MGVTRNAAIQPKTSHKRAAGRVDCNGWRVAGSIVRPLKHNQHVGCPAAGGADGAGSIYHGWHPRGRAESGWNRELRDEPRSSRSIVSVYATGLALIAPPQADGSLVELPLPANVLPVQLQPPCAGPVCLPLDFQVLYGGPA